MVTATKGGNRQAETVERAGPSMDEVLAQTQARLMERPEMLQMRMENETIMAECRVRPRDLEAIKEELAEQLRVFPELADASIYRKPVGKNEQGVMQYAEGLSIRAAEVLAEMYGYNRVRADVSPLDDLRVKIDASFTDFQRGRVWQDGGIVTKQYKSKGGKVAVHPDDRFYSIVVKAEASRRLREVILRSINAALKAWYEAQCVAVLSATLDDKAVNQIVKSFAGIGVTEAQLESVTRPRAMGWTSQDRLTLVGLWNAIKDGETSSEEAFGGSAPQTQQQAGHGPVKTADLEKPKEVPADLSIETIRKRFAACKSAAEVLSVVGAIKREHVDPPLTGEEWDEIDKLAAMANERFGG